MATEIIVWNSFEKIFKTYVNMIFFETVEISTKNFEVTCKYEYFLKMALSQNGYGKSVAWRTGEVSVTVT